MYIKYKIMPNTDNGKEFVEIGRFKELYWDEDYKCVVLSFEGILDLFIPVDEDNEQNFANKIFEALEKGVANIEIKGICFYVETDEEYEDYISPEEFEKIKNKYARFERYDVICKDNTILNSLF